MENVTVESADAARVLLVSQAGSCEAEPFARWDGYARNGREGEGNGFHSFYSYINTKKKLLYVIAI
jgi:hypothetical protein